MTPDITNRHFGQFGGQYIPETLVEAHRELEVVRATSQAMAHIVSVIVPRPRPRVRGSFPPCVCVCDVCVRQAYAAAQADPAFHEEVAFYRKQFIGGPTPMYHAKRITEVLGGAQVWFKRYDPPPTTFD